MEQDPDEFIARSYQVELCEVAMKGNIIIYLPTGAGKTFIAVMAIKQLSADLHKPQNEGRKHTIFAVRTIPLVVQQSQYIERLTGLSCGSYTGDMNVDFWKQDDWAKELAENQVLVMTAQILFNILCSGYMQLEKINLIIFDECHCAVNDDPMRQIMKLFAYCPVEQQPRVIGLTASLVNCNVKVKDVLPTIEQLETTFHAKVATTSSWESLRTYYVSAKEIILSFDPYDMPSVGNDVFAILTDIDKVVEYTKFNVHIDIEASSKEFQPRSMNSKFSSIMRNIVNQLETNGLYGTSISTLLYLIQLEKYKRVSTEIEQVYVLEYLITELITARMMLEHKMQSESQLERIVKYSSDKVRKLFILLKDTYTAQPKSSKFCCIIFVQQKFTAKVIYHILKNLNTYSEDYKFLLPDYIIGHTVNPIVDTREAMCISKWNKEAFHRFRTGVTNCIVATNIVDEGVDIPTCSLIVRYDPPLDVRSYIQSKGRGRHKDSKFVLLTPSNNKQLLVRYNNYRTVESYLKQYLSKYHKERLCPSQENIQNELYVNTIEPYIITCADGTQSVLNETRAVSLVNDYCLSLLTSKFIRLSPIWRLNKGEENVYQVSLKLPIVSLCKDVIMGDVMETIKGAKRSAAMKTCIKLHKLRELSDNLRPSTNEVILRDVDYLYPNWKDEKISECENNGKNKQTYDLQFPEATFGAFPVKNKQLYLHILHMKPTYSVPHDNASLVFYNLLKKDAGYAILSTKELPQIPSFPIFMSVGELIVNVQVNYKRLELTQLDIDKLIGFHSLVFEEICRVIKSFMVFDTYNLDNCFLITPVDEKSDINWNVVNEYQSIRRIVPTIPLEFQSRNYELAVVIPNYRGSNEVYVITQICDDLTPESCFPTDDYSSFASYYEIKHGIKIKDLTQPMLEVKPLSNKINCIKPRDMAKLGLGKRKRADLIKSGFMEHLVPELCTRIIFPSLYWLKATTLPSILHRVSQLLIADDLRRVIVQETGLGSIHLPDGKAWPVLKPSEHNEATDDSEMLQDRLVDETVDYPQENSSLRGPEIDILSEETDHYPWPKDEEPVELDKNIDRIQVIDVEYYCKFMSETCPLEKVNYHTRFQENPGVVAPNLLIFMTSDKFGPDPVQIMCALTAKASNDMINLERLETLGDSYLKFITSLFLFTAFPMSTEGPLTQLKGKMVGNRNLYYSGCEKKIPGYMKIDEFTPDTFIPPAFTTFRPLQKKLLQDGKSPSVLYELDMPREERFRGCLTEATMEKILHIVRNWNDSESPTGMEHYLGMQNVGRKNVADSVEALIGVYLRSMGVKGAAKLLSWFQVLPRELDIDKLLHNISEHPAVLGVHEHLPSASAIETKLGYKFRNRSYLLQALTHPSYIAPGVSESYQRLEFLGDSILDFLITAYIYENCGNLTPGELTDLRSALVNNITFACLATRYGFHTGLLAHAPELIKMIDRFVKFQVERQHIVDDTLLWILLEEEDCNIAEYVDVPKALGDIFESIIGAIYLDSGKDLQKVWRIIYSLMHKEIETFSNDVPKNPIRKLYETAGARPLFRNAVVIEAGICMVPLQVTISGKVKNFHGFGCNKKLAKCAAAKQALKHILFSKT